MLQTLLNLFKPYKKEPVEVKVEDTVKVEAPAPVEAKVETTPEVKAPPAPTPEPKVNKGRPKGAKPAAKPNAVKSQRKKK